MSEDQVDHRPGRSAGWSAASSSFALATPGSRTAAADRKARARGDELRRYTWEDVTGGRAFVVRELRSRVAPR